MTGASQRTSIADLADRGLVAEDADGRPVLTEGIRSALVALHRPERVIRVVRRGTGPDRVSWLCRQGDQWVRSERAPSAGETLAWPLSCDDITAWFAEHLLADLPAALEDGSGPLAEVTLTDETHARRTVRGTAFPDRWTLHPEPTDRARPRQLPAHSPLPSVFHSLLALLD